MICPRVTDAAVVIGPAAWKFHWDRDDYDALAGALTAGPVSYTHLTLPTKA